MSTINQDFLDILCKNLKNLKGSDDLDMDRELKSLGLDSMSSIELLIQIEVFFGIAIPDEFLVDDTFSSARRLWNIIESIILKDLKV